MTVLAKEAAVKRTSKVPHPVFVLCLAAARLEMYTHKEGRRETPVGCV